MSEEIESLRLFRASLEATRRIVASIRADLETAIKNHGAFQDNTEFFCEFLNETRESYRPKSIDHKDYDPETDRDQPERKKR